MNILRKNIISSRGQTGPTKLNYFALKGYHFEDSDGIIFNSADLFYKRYKVINNIYLGVDVGAFSIEKKNIVKYNGIRYGVSLSDKHFSFRLGKNDFDDFSEIVPTIQYENNYKNNSYTLEYTRQNGVFYTYNLCPYEKRIKTDHFSISDYISLKDRSNVWANVTANNYSNGDLGLIGQFDWRFYYNTILDNKLTYNFAVDGYYTTHTKQNNCFYSPHFDDGTFVRIDPDYKINNYLSVLGMLGVGYSLNADQISYKYGLWFHGDPLEDLSYKLGCMKNNSTRGANYHYDECKAELEYRW